MNKKVVLGIAIFCVVIVVAVVIAMTSLSSQDDSNLNENASSSSANNQTKKIEIDKFNGRAIKTQSSIAYKNGSYIYYANKASYNEGLGNIARIDMSNKEKEILYNDCETIEFMTENNIFIKKQVSRWGQESLVSLDLNGKNETEVIPNQCGLYNVINDDIYYSKVEMGEEKFYKYNIKTKENTTLVKSEFTDVVNTTKISIFNNKIYYTKSETDGVTSVYSMNIDGTNSAKMFDIAREDVGSLIVKEDFVLYLANEGLYKANLDGSNEKKISTIITNNIAVTDNYIYYLGEATYKLYRMDLDGNNNVMLVDATIHEYDVIDKKIYYYNHDDSFKMYMCDNNGENIECISIH